MVVLKDTQCALDDNPDSCYGAVNAYWPAMAKEIFTNTDIVNEICVQTADCPAYRYALLSLLLLKWAASLGFFYTLISYT